jgi:hypothetical protein
MEAPFFEKEGSRDKASRWFEWHRQMEALLPYMSMLKFVLLRVGLEAGWATNVEDFAVGRPLPPPSGGGGGDAGDLPAPVAAASAAASSSGAGASSDDTAAKKAMEEKRAKTKNTMHLACSIMCNEGSVRLMKILAVTSRPSRAFHRDQVHVCSTQLGGLEWWQSVAAEKWVSTASDLVAMMSSSTSLGEMGFRLDALPSDDPDAMLEAKMASSLFSLVVELLGVEVQDMFMYSRSLPGKFGALLHPDDECRESAFTFCLGCSKALDKLEAKSKDAEDNFFQDFMMNLMWPNACWTREILCALRENEGGPLPPMIVNELRSVGRCFKSTRCCELQFNHIRKCARLQASAKMSRQSRWYSSFTKKKAFVDVVSHV